MNQKSVAKPPKAFEDFAHQAWIAGKVEFRGLEIFHEAARILGPAEVEKVIVFLDALVQSSSSDREIQKMWFQSKTYGPEKAAEARPFTQTIIELLTYPRAPRLSADL